MAAIATTTTRDKCGSAAAADGDDDAVASFAAFWVSVVGADDAALSAPRYGRAALYWDRVHGTIRKEVDSQELACALWLQHHPHIVPVTRAELSPRGRQHWTLHMPVAQGTDAITVLQARSAAREAPIHRRSVWHHLCRQLISAVAFMHASGVVHQDLKPDNVLIAHEIQWRDPTSVHVWLADFGSSRLVDPSAIAPVSVAPFFPRSDQHMNECRGVGSRNTLPPELLLHSDVQLLVSEDPAALHADEQKRLPACLRAIDMWQLGLLLFSVWTFQQAPMTSAGLCKLMREGDSAKFNDRVSECLAGREVPPLWQRAIRAALQVDPRKRATAAALIDMVATDGGSGGRTPVAAVASRRV